MKLLDGGASGPQSALTVDASDEVGPFVKTVVADTETVWSDLFESQNLGRTYASPKVILYSGQTYTGTSMVADCRLGPFYLPASQEILLDPSFFSELRSKLGAPGDFAQAYVIAHEVGHHVQHLLGTSEQVHRRQQQVPKLEANQLSVRLELQADFLAGVWAHHAEKKWRVLEEGDMEEAVTAANAIGDDRLQRNAGQRVDENAFTHGTSQQRVRWFMKGFRSGQVRDGDTLSIPYHRL
jgi:predicted metalloprotease